MGDYKLLGLITPARQVYEILAFADCAWGAALLNNDTLSFDCPEVRVHDATLLRVLGPHVRWCMRDGTPVAWSTVAREML